LLRYFDGTAGRPFKELGRMRCGSLFRLRCEAIYRTLALLKVDCPLEKAYGICMDIQLSEEAARYIEDHLIQVGCGSPREFMERILRGLRRAEEVAIPAEKWAWLQAQETAAAKLWNNDADARYDAL